MKPLINHTEGYYHFFLLGLHICIVDRKKHPYVIFSKRKKEKKFFKYGITISKYNPKQEKSLPEVIVSCDTSLSKFAVVVWIDGKPIDRKVFKTGETKVKKKLKSVTYFDNKIEQINWITNEVIKFIEPYKPQKICLESLSFSSIGNQTRNLAGVYHVFCDKLVEVLGLDFSDITPIPPTVIKATARTFYPLEEQTYTNTKGKTSKKEIGKPEVMFIANQLHPEVLEGYSKSASSEKAGYEDLSDALLCYYAYKKGLV